MSGLIVSASGSSLRRFARDVHTAASEITDNQQGAILISALTACPVHTAPVSEPSGVFQRQLHEALARIGVRLTGEELSGLQDHCAKAFPVADNDHLTWMAATRRRA